MYFQFHENLPASVTRAVFHFYTKDDPGRLPFYLAAAVHRKSAMVNVPEEATHLRSICFLTSKNTFTYYYPDEGYDLLEGGYLPPLKTHAVGELYAGGMVMQTGMDRPDTGIDTDILPYKGKIITLKEETAPYQEEKNEDCPILPEESLLLAGAPCTSWHLPDILELATLYRHQSKLNELLKRNGGELLSQETYWCRDDSVIELGVAFDMATGRPAIVPKEEPHQIRRIRGY